jgi:hypothetical protein
VGATRSEGELGRKWEQARMTSREEEVKVTYCSMVIRKKSCCKEEAQA